MDPARTLLMPLIAAVLSGCFASETPLIADKDAVAPYAVITFRETDSDEAQTLRRSGTAYVADDEDIDLVVRFMPLAERGWDTGWYVAEATGSRDGEVMRIYAVVEADFDDLTAATYVAVADDGDTGAGLAGCGDGIVCIDSLNAYLDFARAKIDDGADPDTEYDITLE
jgi:hypothetical protein